MKDLLKAYQGISRFNRLSDKAREIVFYAEDEKSWDHLGPLLLKLTQDYSRPVCYLTSSQSDPLLKKTPTNTTAFFVGAGFFRTYLFSALNTKVCVMTMPDLENYHLKRSKLSQVHYVYVFHSLVSTHMAYRKGAFDAFDTILCAGPHHVQEIRAWENAHGLKPKQLVSYGYPRLERLIRENKKPSERKNTPCVLVAPSWGKDALLETKGHELLACLFERGYRVILRPHPRTLRDSSSVIRSLMDKFSGTARLTLVDDVRSSQDLHESDLMISDFSGAALEYALGLLKPVVFVDSARKINNPLYHTVSLEPVEVAWRERLGAVIAPEEIKEIGRAVDSLLEHEPRVSERIQEFRNHAVFHLGHSLESGVQAILRAADPASTFPESKVRQQGHKRN